MRKSTIVAGIVLVLAVVVCTSAFANDGSGTTAWHGFWNSVGGFIYNAMPWNWGNWAGK